MTIIPPNPVYTEDEARIRESNVIATKASYNRPFFFIYPPSRPLEDSEAQASFRPDSTTIPQPRWSKRNITLYPHLDGYNSSTKCPHLDGYNSSTKFHHHTTTSVEHEKHYTIPPSGRIQLKPKMPPSGRIQLKHKIPRSDDIRKRTTQLRIFWWCSALSGGGGETPPYPPGPVFCTWRSGWVPP